MPARRLRLPARHPSGRRRAARHLAARRLPRRPPGSPGRVRGQLGEESGSAVVGFVLVVVVSVALLQLVLGLHVRNVLTDAAGEGARRAALVGGTSAEAEARVRALVGAALADDYVDSVSVTRTQVQGVAVVEVEVGAPLPVLGLLGPRGTLTVTGHAVDEAALTGKAPAP